MGSYWTFKTIIDKKSLLIPIVWIMSQMTNNSDTSFFCFFFFWFVLHRFISHRNKKKSIFKKNVLMTADIFRKIATLVVEKKNWVTNIKIKQHAKKNKWIEQVSLVVLILKGLKIDVLFKTEAFVILRMGASFVFEMLWRSAFFLFVIVIIIV